MEMSNALQKNLMQLFPNKIIYSAELCKNISVHMALHREAKRAGVSSRQLTESKAYRQLRQKAITTPNNLLP